MEKVIYVVWEQDGFDTGDEHLRFGWETSGDRIEAPFLLAREESVDGSFAGVVRCQREPPVFEMPV